MANLIARIAVLLVLAAAGMVLADRKENIDLSVSLLLFLAALVGRAGDLPPADTPDTRRLKTVVQLVNEGYAGALHVTDAAAACGCSPSHFMRWFKKMTGQGFTEYLNEQRLNAAADALRSGSDTVLAIAEQCGFENLSYFNRLFKKRYGMTPRE